VVNFSVGDSAGTGAAVTVVDLTNLQVKVMIAEVDIAKIKIGQSTQITLDALPGKTYTAKIIAIGPVATITQGVVNYPVTAAIHNNDGQVKPGMTANLAITVEQRDNVLLIPNRAIRTQGNQKTVTVLYKGQSISMPVTVGLTNDQSAEITGGLLEGDQVIIQTTQTRQTGGIMGGGPVFVTK
jgi:RND family efflux transporter MFP subunit